MSIRQLRNLIFPLTILLVLALAACSSESTTPTVPLSAPTQAPTAVPTQAPTALPTPAAIVAPTAAPKPTPTMAPTAASTPAPTTASTAVPTTEPTATPTPTAAPTPEPAIMSLQGVRGIVDPTNFGWPREVEGLNGVVSIPSKPERIITASVGHDEMAVALVPVDRLVGVGTSTKDSTYSNVASLVQDIAEISRDPETIIAQAPDVIVTSPFFSAEAVEALSKIGIPVVQTELQQGPEARINSILLMGYIFGEEERAHEFAAEVQNRYDSLVTVTSKAEPRPKVLALSQYSDKLWVAGGDSTEGGVIMAAGGINAAEEAGIEGNQTTSLEGVIAMNPDVIVIAQPLAFGAEGFRQSLLSNEVLSEIPAIKNNQVHLVEGKHFTTLSYWNIRGAEDLARILWPEDFPEPSTATFSLAE